MKNKDKSSKKNKKKTPKNNFIHNSYKLSWSKSNKKLKNLYNENFKELKKS